MNNFITLVLFLLSVQTQWTDASDDTSATSLHRNAVQILQSLSLSSELKYPYCALESEFLESARKVYSREDVVAANPFCGRSLVVAYSNMEPLVYLNKSGLVDGVLPGNRLYIRL